MPEAAGEFFFRSSPLSTMLWFFEGVMVVLMLGRRKVGFWPGAAFPTSLTSRLTSSVTSPPSLMYGVKSSMIPESMYVVVVVVTGGFVLLASTEETIGTWVTTLILDFFPFAAITFGEERIDAFPERASELNAAVRTFVFSTRYRKFPATASMGESVRVCWYCPLCLK